MTCVVFGNLKCKIHFGDAFLNDCQDVVICLYHMTLYTLINVYLCMCIRRHLHIQTMFYYACKVIIVIIMVCCVIKNNYVTLFPENVNFLH